MSDYCIYLDADSSDMSIEHILPLSLGGVDAFSIQADRRFNNSVGSSVDGAIANDFLVLFKRDRAGAKGHSGKHPVPIIKRAELDDGAPVQARFAKEGLQLFDVKERRDLTRAEASNRQVKLSSSIDLNAEVKFLAKVALAAGYFAYGELFRKHVQHSEARTIVNAASLTDIRPDVRMWSRFESVDGKSAAEAEHLNILRAMTESAGGSCVILLPGPDSFGVVVGVLGDFMGMINMPANTTGFPNSGDYQMGHCIFLQDGQMVRRSFLESLALVLTELENDSLMATSKLEAP